MTAAGHQCRLPGEHRVVPRGRATLSYSRPAGTPPCASTAATVFHSPAADDRPVPPRRPAGRHRRGPTRPWPGSTSRRPRTRRSATSTSASGTASIEPTRSRDGRGSCSRRTGPTPCSSGWRKRSACSTWRPTRSHALATIPDANPRTIINDGEVVPGGRAVVFGTKDVRFADPIAHLYLFTLDDRLTTLADGQLCSNGKVFARDRRLYDIDTPRRNVIRYRLDLDGGSSHDGRCRPRPAVHEPGSRTAWCRRGWDRSSSPSTTPIRSPRVGRSDST